MKITAALIIALLQTKYFRALYDQSILKANKMPDWYEPTPEPTFFEKIIVLVMMIISAIFFQSGKQNRNHRGKRFSDDISKR